MAVSNTVTLVQYAGNGSSVTAYPTQFPFTDEAWVNVVVMDAAGATTALELGSTFFLTGVGDDAGGDVTTSAAWDSTHTITIYRRVPQTQLLELEYNTRLPAAAVEASLDKITFMIQELLSERPVSFPAVEDPANDTELPPAPLRKNSVLGFDSATGEAVLFNLPVPTVPVAPPGSGIYVLGAVDGVMAWMETVNCAVTP